ncbi:ATP-binding cassette domain-containing protein, partial [Bradyrhizobium sp.]|uniref:ATP-binding cassette domain-containing protein n=1 Tax=Bradyrhizobium sp. TaxID=376 RepID=UPI003C6F461E
MTDSARDPILRLDHVGVRFDALKAVDDVSLRVGRGERRAIIGPNGAGKTT